MLTGRSPAFRMYSANFDQDSPINSLFPTDGSDFKGERLTVQFARGPRRKENLPGPMDRPSMPRPRRTIFRMMVSGLPETSWQVSSPSPFISDFQDTSHLGHLTIPDSMPSVYALFLVLLLSLSPRLKIIANARTSRACSPDFRCQGLECDLDSMEEDMSPPRHQRKYRGPIAEETLSG